MTPFQQAHTFVVSSVIAPSFTGDGLTTALLNNNQLGVILQANSGLPFNIRSNQDLNRDGQTNDRPLGIDRNTGRLGRVVYLDLRYSRFIPLPSEQRIELFFEAKNLFNTENVAVGEPHRDHRRRGQPIGTLARSLPADRRLRSAADATGGKVRILIVDSLQSLVVSHSRQCRVVSRQFQSSIGTGFD